MSLWYWRRFRSMPLGEIRLRALRTLRNRRDRLRLERRGPEAVAGPVPDPEGWLRRPDETPWLFTAEETAARAGGVPAAWPERTLERAGHILEGRFDWLGSTYVLGERPDWRCEPVSGLTFPPVHWSALPHSATDDRFDYKHLWEPNIHESLVTLAKAFLFTGRADYRDRLDALWRDWMEQNPPLCGPNYLAPVEIGLRLLSWAGAIRFRAAREPVPEELARDLWAHVHFQRDTIAQNLSRYSSANNHLIGELASLALTDLAFPGMAPEAETLLVLEEFWEQILLQFATDGGNREQAFHYHVFALSFGLLVTHAARRAKFPVPGAATERLQKAVQFLETGLDGRGRPFLYGDSDESEVLPLADGERDIHGSVLALGRTLFDATSDRDERVYWLTGEAGPDTPPERHPRTDPHVATFPDAGHVFARHGDLDVHFNGGALGYLSIAAHAHADALATEVRFRGRDVVVDPGTYSYRGANRWREFLVSSTAHATTAPEGVKPAERMGPFLWGRHYPTCLAGDSGDGSAAVGVLEFPNGMRVERRVTIEADQVRIEDRWSGSGSGATEVRLTWPLGPGDITVDAGSPTLRGQGFRAHFTITGLDASPTLHAGDPRRPGTPCRSPGYDRLEPGSTLEWRGRLPEGRVISTLIRLESDPESS